MSVVGILVAAATILGLGATFTRPATWSVRAAALSLLGIGLGLAILALNPRPNAQARETFDD